MCNIQKNKLQLHRLCSRFLLVCLIINCVLNFNITSSKAATTPFIDMNVEGTISIEYDVNGYFDEECKSTSSLSCSNVKVSATRTHTVPITVHVTRDIEGKITYSFSSSGRSYWETTIFTLADQLEDSSLGSNVILNGYVDYTDIAFKEKGSNIYQYGKTYGDDWEQTVYLSISQNLKMTCTSIEDTNPDWKITWSSINLKPKIATVKFTIPGFKKLSIDWDDGVSYVEDFSKEEEAYYIKGDRAYTFIHLKEGYDFDYIGEGSNDHHWTDTKWNDTKKRWENSWSMANDREIYIHTKKQIKTLNLSWDSGVNMVIGHSTEGSDMQMSNGGGVGYYYGTTAPAWIYLNDGYDIDYIEDLDSGEKIYVSSSDWNKDNSRYDKYFEMKQNRKLKIHTKLNIYTLTIDPNYGTMYNGSEETSSKFTTKFVYGRKTYIGNSYTDKYGYLDYENNTPTKEGYTFAGWKFSNGTGGLNSDGSEFFFGEIAADEDTTYDDDDIYIFNGDYTGDVTATAQWTKGSYQQNVYVRYQNEDGSWGDYSDRYWHISTDEAPNGYWEYFRWSIDNGSSFWFGLEDIKQDSKWDDTLYEFPDTFADGSSLSYTVTGESKKYVDIKRKQYTMNFNKGLTNSTATMSDVKKSAGDSYEIPLPKWLGRSYVITLDNDGSKTTISGNLTFDQWKGYKNIPFSEIKKDDARYDWYSDGDLLENIRSNMTFVANWNSEEITLPTPTKSGYIFDGWYEDEAFTKKVNSTTYEVEPDTTALNVTLYAKWTTQTASYTVKHHYMDVNGKYSDSTGLLETETLTAQVGSSVTPNTKARTGFTTPSTQSVIVKADGTTVVDYYYARNKYKVTLTKDDNIDTTTGNGDYYYGASVTVKATVKANTKQYTYNWNTWESSNTNILANSTNKDYTFTMPTNNVTLKATGSNTVNSYTITVNGDNHVTKTSGSGTYKYGTQVTISADTFANGYQFSKWNDGNTNARRTVTVKDEATYTAYKKVIPYSVNYNLNGGVVLGSKKDRQ